MKKFVIHTKSLNNSLVFYRALFDRMPDEFGNWELKYETKEFLLQVIETEDPIPRGEPMSILVQNERELMQWNRRMRRFMKLGRMNNDCLILDRAFGILDPDGNKWIIGNPSTEVNYEQCYITETINNYTYGNF